MSCPLKDTNELNLIREIQRIYTELREERDERKRLEKLLDEVMKESENIKKCTGIIEQDKMRGNSK